MRCAFRGVILGVALTGCTGLIGSTPENRSDSASAAACTEQCVGASSLSRLSRRQYDYAVHDLFGDDVEVSLDLLPIDLSQAGYASNMGALPTDVIVDGIANAAAAVAADVARLKTDAFAGHCDGAEVQAQCVVETLAPLLRRAYGRSVTVTELNAYREVAELALGSSVGLRGAVEWIVQAALQSPHFLYRIEDAEDDAERPLSGVERAKRLSLFLWQSVPDDTLVDAAEAGALATEEGVRTQVTRMMQDARFERSVIAFHQEWLGVTTIDATDREGFTPELSASMQRELRSFALALYASADKTIHDVFESRVTYVDSVLAEHYGLGGTFSNEPSAVELVERAGVLTLGAVLTHYASEAYTRPIFRGKFLRQVVMCQQGAARPDDVFDEQAAREEQLAQAQADGTLSDRERLEIITSGDCQSCHASLNPVGYALEGFDALGRYRTQDENGLPVDSTGQLIDAGDDADGAFTGIHDLAQRLSHSTIAADCLTRQWLRFALGRSLDTKRDAPTIVGSHETFASSGFRLRELVAAVATSRSMGSRRAPTISSDITLHAIEDEQGIDVLGDILTLDFNDGEPTNVYGSGPDGERVGARAAPGKFGQGAALAETNARVELSPEWSLFTGSTATLEAWVYRQTSGSGALGQQTLFGDYAWTDASTPVVHAELEWSIIDSGVRLISNAGCDGEQREVRSESRQVPLATWTHLAVTWDGSAARFYMDGELVDTLPFALTPCARPDGTAFVVGSRADGRGLTGVVDELKFSSYAKDVDMIRRSMLADSTSRRD